MNRGMLRVGFVLLMMIMMQTIAAKEVIPETAHQLTSPDGAYVVDLYQTIDGRGKKQLFYRVMYKGKQTILESELGVLIENQLFESALAVPNDDSEIWGENLRFTGVRRDSADTVWKPVYGEYAAIRDNYNELTLHFSKGEQERPSYLTEGYDKNKGYFMDVVVRAYNEGVAFRYHFPEPSNGLFLHIVGEQTQFAMPEGTKAYYERWAQGPYTLLPLEGWNGESERPLTMVLPNGLSVALTEAQMTDYVRMKPGLHPEKKNTLQVMLYSSVDVIPAYSTPWRVIMAAEKPTELIANNTLILNLNPENKLNDVSWIKPGKVIRVTRLTQADALKYIDFAAERGLDYVHFDAGWYGPEMRMSSSALKVSSSRDLDIPEVVRYAAQKGIGLWVYVNQRALYQELDSILPLYQKWGIKGIKFGFVQVGNQYWTNWLHQAIISCARHELMVDIHDEYRPTGFSRTYPNLMTMEGIKGNEEFPDATHNTLLPFTRFVAGAADYTICYYDKRIKTTHAHQLALSVVYYSPIQYLFWYDNPSHYEGEPEVDFFKQLKTVWDDTKVLTGEIGSHIAMARRSGDEWFVGAITNNEPGVVQFKTDFLEAEKPYLATFYTDDDTQPTKTKVKVTRLIVDASSNVKMKLKASGGCAVHLKPAEKRDLKTFRKYSLKTVL